MNKKQVWDTYSTLWKFMKEILEWSDKQLQDMDITSQTGIELQDMI